MFNEIDLDNFEANLEANLQVFEQEGANLTRPVLAEGYYPAQLKELSARFGITEKVSKGNPKGEPKAWVTLGANFIVDSAIARESLKQDNNPVVYTDNESTFLPQFFNLSDFGFTQNDNGQLWQFVGSILTQVNLAELKEVDGNKSYLIDTSIVRAIFDDKYKDEVKRLYGLAKAGEAISDDEKLNNVLLIPAMLAKVLVGNISTLLTDQIETSGCVILVARKKDDRSKELLHYAKNYILGNDVAEYEDRLLK